MVDKGNATGGSKPSKPTKNKDGGDGVGGSSSNVPATVSNNGNLKNDPVLAGLGSIIGGIMANRIAASQPGNKCPDACPIQ